MSLTALAIALSIAATPVMAAADLQSVQWDKRVLVIFAEENTPMLDEQVRLLNAARVGLEERDMLVLSVAGDKVETVFGRAGSFAAEALRRSLSHQSASFEVVLVGKDGGVKLRQNAPLPPEQLFATVDAMPMRVNEMAHDR